jgi:hypothetical protein
MALYPRPGVPYDQGPMRRHLRPLALLALTLAPSVATAKPKKAAAGGSSAPACGATVLPLVVGNQWTYAQAAAPEPATSDIQRISPPLPKSLLITVKTIEAKGGDTVVTLEEKISYDYTRDTKKPILEDRIVVSTITCNAKKFDISPESFFFAGEPGGYTGLVINKLDRKGTSWQLTKGTFGENEWPEDLAIQWTRTAHEASGATYGSGKLEMERRITPLEPEAIITKAGSYPKAEKLAIKTTGRITLEKPLTADLKPMELPADWLNQLWFVEGTGVVASLNRFAHMYHLVDSQLK